MTDFWKDLGDGVKSGVDWLTEKTESAVKSGKKSVNRLQLQADLDRAFDKLGRDFYLMSQQGDLKIDELKESCDKIKAMQDEFSSLQP